MNKLISLNSPKDIVEHEEKSLGMVTGEAYLRTTLDKDDYDQLRYKLINLFIPWCGFERYFEDRDFENSKEIFSNRDNVPKDDSGGLLVSVQAPMEGAIEGYLSSEEVRALPDSVMISLDAIVDDEDEDDVRFSQFIDRVLKSGFGLYYQLNIGFDS
ncbi:hypothetical protein CWC15_11290 [Pseudoalteromonas spongiae]|nr:hypothetical protein CWC15_11290 [Pseudoalteromonas spongiae]